MAVHLVRLALGVLAGIAVVQHVHRWRRGQANLRAVAALGWAGVMTGEALQVFGGYTWAAPLVLAPSVLLIAAVEVTVGTRWGRWRGQL